MAAASYWSPEYGGIPNLPAYTTDKTSTLGTDVQGQLIQNLPNYQSLVSKASSNIGAGLQGQVAPDVAANLGVKAAEFGVGTGMPMSQASATNFLSRYGLTSYQTQQDAQKNLLAQMQATPIQQSQTGTQTTDLGAQRAIYAAAPSPAAAAGASMRAAQAGIGAGRGGVAAPGAVSAPTAGMGYGNLTDAGGGGGAKGFTANSFGDFPTSGQSAPGVMGGNIDANGDEWVPIGGGQKMNLTTGDVQAGQENAGADLGFQDTSGGSMYMGDQSGYDDSWLNEMYGEY